MSAAYYPIGPPNSNTGNSQEFVASVQYIGVGQQPGVVQPAAGQQYMAQPGQHVQMVMYTPSNYNAVASQQQPGVAGGGVAEVDLQQRRKNMVAIAVFVITAIVVYVIWELTTTR